MRRHHFSLGRVASDLVLAASDEFWQTVTWCTARERAELRKELERAPTKALLDCLYLKSDEKIYPHPQHYRRVLQSLAAIGPEDPVPMTADLAMIVNRPLKIRTYGFNAERAAWNLLCDSIRRP